MNRFMDIIEGRRSVRDFEDKKIPDDMMTTLLESVRWAQSWANTQCWEVVVVTDQAIKERLAEAVYKANPARKSVLAAPVIFVMCARLKSSGYYKGEVTTKFGDWFMFDIGVATQNLCLCAHSLGLGSVVMGLFDHDAARKVLNVPDGYEVVSLVPVGYPSKIPAAPKRRQTEEFTRYNSF